ncbi:MAG: DMT family transporter [Gammaproteobacteria bacterium]
MSKRITIMLVILSTLFWGANFNVGKVVVEHLSPLVAASARFFLATLLISIIMLLKESSIREAIKTNWRIYILLGVIGVAGFNGLFFWGLKYTTPVNGALIMATNPLVTLILASILLGESIRLNQRIGILFSFVGVVIVVTRGSFEMLSSLSISIGDWIIMAANLCWALYGVLSRRYIKNNNQLNTTTVTMAIGTIILMLAASFDGGGSGLFVHNWIVCGALVFMAIFGSVLAYLFWNYGIANLGAGQTSIFFNLVPIFTVLISILVGQPVSGLQILAGVFVILGVLISANVIKNPINMVVKARYKNASL